MYEQSNDLDDKNQNSGDQRWGKRMKKITKRKSTMKKKKESRHSD